MSDSLTLELTIPDRLMLGALLGPIAGDVVTLRIVRGLQEELLFSEEEAEALGIKAVGEQVTWNPEAPQTKEFSFGRAAVDIITDQLKKANASKTLTLPQLGLFEKFCPEEEVEA